VFKVRSNSADQTIHYGQKLSAALRERQVVVLEGALGGGKTTFVKGVLKGLGYRKRVLSPSFTLIRRYATKKFLVYHVDLYRLGKRDTYGLGMDDFIYSPGTLTLIEWGNKIKADFDRYIQIKFSFMSRYRRELLFSARGCGSKESAALREALAG